VCRKGRGGKEAQSLGKERRPPGLYIVRGELDRRARYFLRLDECDCKFFLRHERNNHFLGIIETLGQT
jgi:hypothetical protein